MRRPCLLLLGLLCGCAEPQRLRVELGEVPESARGLQAALLIDGCLRRLPEQTLTRAAADGQVEVLPQRLRRISLDLPVAALGPAEGCAPVAGLPAEQRLLSADLFDEKQCLVASAAQPLAEAGALEVPLRPVAGCPNQRRPLPVVLAVTDAMGAPLRSVPAQERSEVRLRGHGLLPGTTVQVDGQEAEVQWSRWRDPGEIVVTVPPRSSVRQRVDVALRGPGAAAATSYPALLSYRDEAIHFEKQEPIETLHGGRFLALGDVDGDGLPDLAVSGLSTAKGAAERILILLNTKEKPGGLRRQVRSVEEVGGAGDFLHLADINGDGRPDLIHVDRAGASGYELQTYLNQGRAPFFPRFERATLVERDAGFMALFLGAAEAGGRREPWFLWEDRSQAAPGTWRLRQFAGLGSGALRQRAECALSADREIVAQRQLVADMDGDGAEDLVLPFRPGRTGLSGNRVTVVLNRAGRCGTEVNYPLPTMFLDFSRALAVGDVDGDRAPDVATVRETLVIARNSGRGELLEKDGITVGGRAQSGQSDVAPPGPRPVEQGGGVALGDLNGDGRADLVLAWSAANGTSLRVQSYLNAAADGLAPAFLPKMRPGYDEVDLGPSGYGAGDILIEDMNGDGRPDLVIADRLTQLGTEPDAVIVLLNRPGPRPQ